MTTTDLEVLKLRNLHETVISAPQNNFYALSHDFD